MSRSRLAGLYAITASQIDNPSTPLQVRAALQGGAKLIQYRDKSRAPDARRQQALQLRGLCHAYQALLIINDDLELAVACQADGVHLGRDDAPLPEARRVLGDHAIIGASCYNDLQRAHDAQQQGANYLAFGSFYASPTKPQAAKAEPHLLREARKTFTLPICAIGGIRLDNAAPLLAAGAEMLAVSSGLFNTGNIAQTARGFAALCEKQTMGSHSPQITEQ